VQGCGSAKMWRSRVVAVLCWDDDGQWWEPDELRDESDRGGEGGCHS
jgi:hypothetical protein